MNEMTGRPYRIFHESGEFSATNLDEHFTLPLQNHTIETA